MFTTHHNSVVVFSPCFGIGRHVVFGTILEGMKFVREIEKQNGTPPAEDWVWAWDIRLTEEALGSRVSRVS